MIFVPLQVYSNMGNLTLAIMGTGTQAEYHIKAMLALERCTDIREAIQ